MVFKQDYEVYNVFHCLNVLTSYIVLFVMWLYCLIMYVMLLALYLALFLL